MGTERYKYSYRGRERDYYMMRSVLWLGCGHRKSCQIPFFVDVVVVVVVVFIFRFDFFFHYMHASTAIFDVLSLLLGMLSAMYNCTTCASMASSVCVYVCVRARERGMNGMPLLYSTGANKWEKRTYFYCSLRSWLLFKYGWTSLFGLSYYTRIYYNIILRRRIAANERREQIQKDNEIIEF